MSEEKVRDFSLFGILLAVFIFIAPLESFFLTGSGSVVKFYAIGYAALVFLRIVTKNIRIRLDGTNLSVVLFVAIVSASVLWSPHMSRGTNVMAAIGLQCLLIIMVAQMDYTEKEKMLFLMCYVASCIVLSMMVYSNKEMLEAGLRASASVSEDAVVDPNNISGLIAGGIAVILNFDTKNKLWNILKIVVGVMLVTALFMTASRGAFLAMIMVCIFSLLNKKGIKSKVGILIVILLVVLLIVYFSSYLFGDTNPINMLFERFEEDQTGSGRTDLWKHALKAIWERPIFGYGLGESPYVIGEASTRNLGSHNTYFTIWMEGGIIAIAMFLSIYVTLWKNRKKEEMYSNCVFGVLISSMVVSFFIDTYNKKILWLPILLCVIANAKKRKVKLGHKI